MNEMCYSILCMKFDTIQIMQKKSKNNQKKKVKKYGCGKRKLVARQYDSLAKRNKLTLKKSSNEAEVIVIEISLKYQEERK